MAVQQLLSVLTPDIIRYFARGHCVQNVGLANLKGFDDNTVLHGKQHKLAVGTLWGPAHAAP